MYKSINDIPSEYQILIKRMIKNGLIEQDDNNNINISEDLLNMILILSKLGLIP